MLADGGGALVLDPQLLLCGLRALSRSCCKESVVILRPAVARREYKHQRRQRKLGCSNGINGRQARAHRCRHSQTFVCQSCILDDVMKSEELHLLLRTAAPSSHSCREQVRWGAGERVVRVMRHGNGVVDQAGVSVRKEWAIGRVRRAGQGCQGPAIAHCGVQSGYTHMPERRVVRRR